MAQIAQTADFRVAVTNKQILSIALPISASILVPQLNFITNNIFLGGLGQQELGVAGITGVYYLIFAVIGNGLNNGLQTLIARRAGENRIDAIGSLFAQGVRIALAVSVFGILFTWFLAPTILRWALNDQQNVDMAVSFLRIRIFGLPFLYLYQLRNALLVGTNNTKLLVVGTATEAVTNVFFDYTLIYGKWGMPEMGFNGAALASIIAEFAGLIVIFWVIRSKGVSGQLQLFSNFRWHADNTRKILIISAPLVMQHAISIITWEFFYILVEHHGNRDLAISNTMRNIFGFFGCFTWAFAATTTTMVSNVIGQGLEDKVPELLRRIIYWSMGFAIGVCLLLNIAPGLFLSIYGQGDDFIQAAIPVLRVVSLALVIMSFSVVWMNAVTGSGHSKMTLLAEVIAIVLYSIYVYTTLEYLHVSITWGWGSEWVYWLSIFIPCYWFMRSGKWKHKSI